MTKLHTITVSKIERLTKNAITLSLDIPENLKEVFKFKAGQYITVELDINHKATRRSYSICSSTNENILKIGVKKVANGLVSSYINDHLSTGNTIRAMPPEGRFTRHFTNGEHHLLLASGSGITPCLSITKSVLENNQNSKVTLIYGNQSVASIMFREELSILKDQYTDRFFIAHILSREAQDVAILNGRLDNKKLEQLITKNLIKVTDFDNTFICGPQLMIEGISATLKAAGMAKEKIYFELFGANQTQNSNENAQQAIGEGYVDIIIEGSQKRILIDGKKHTVLSAAQSAGLDLPYSCAGGMCCTCRCKILEGEAEMDINYSLEDWEIKAGFTLACQARPKTKTLKLDFDAV